MSTTVIVGTQWGDEGKGRLCDYLAADADVVVRYQGGNNAGHTVVVGDAEYKLHLIPSGILRPGALCVMADGMLVDPLVLSAELEGLEARGVDVSGLRISSAAHVIMPYHPLIDQLEEERRGTAKIGTTARGVGPAYADKSKRCGIRIGDLLDPEYLLRRVEGALSDKNVLMEHYYNHEPVDAKEVCEQVLRAAEKIKPYIADTRRLLVEAKRANKRILFEGAQATFLDLDYGAYPNVTSSHPVAGGACLGTGIAPKDIDRVIGIVKAYATRVGSGPFPTELEDDLGQELREHGREYGTTTGRPRRCGWLDMVMVNMAASLNGLTDLAVTKLDVLDSLETIRICVGYECNGEKLNTVPTSDAQHAACTPIYEDVPGWQCSTEAARKPDDLPPAARAFLDRVAELAGVPVSYASLGPERDQLVVF